VDFKEFSADLENNYLAMKEYDKFFYLLSKLISELGNKGYSFHRIDELL